MLHARYDFLFTFSAVQDSYGLGADPFCLLIQVQSIVNIANSTFTLLEKLSPSLRAVSTAAVGKALYLQPAASPSGGRLSLLVAVLSHVEPW